MLVEMQIEILDGQRSWLFSNEIFEKRSGMRGWSQTNFVELWSVSRPRFGRDGHRDMGDVSTLTEIWVTNVSTEKLFGLMKPPGSNLCADTRRYKYFRSSQTVKTERDLH